MLNLLKKSPTTLYHLDEQQLRELPSAKLFRILLDKALDANASAIIFGTPIDTHPPEGISHEWPDIRTPLWLDINGALQPFFHPIPFQSYIQFLWNLDFLLVSLIPTPDEPPARFADLMESFMDSLPQVPAPATRTPFRFIELPSPNPSTRRFLQVTLHMAHDNTLHLKLHGIREEPSTIRVPRRL